MRAHRSKEIFGDVVQRQMQLFRLTDTVCGLDQMRDEGRGRAEDLRVRTVSLLPADVKEEAAEAILGEFFCE